MHLIRLLLAGITVLEEGVIPVHVGEHRERLLMIRRGEMDWAELDDWRRQLLARLDTALFSPRLPEQPDRAWADRYLIRARRSAVTESRE